MLQRTRGAPGKVLSLCQLPQHPPGAGQLGLEILAAPINPVDQLRCRGHYPLLSPLPGILGCEGVARVQSLGLGVAASWQVGDLVLLPPRVGSFRSHINLPAKDLLALPPEIDPLQASMLAIGATSAKVLLEQCQAQAPLISAPASGVVGQCVAQLAHMHKLSATHLVQDPRWCAKIQKLHPQGSVQTLEEFCQQAGALPGQTRARTALDGVGGETSRAMLSQLEPGGTLYSYGAMSRQAPKLQLADLLFAQIRIEGFWLYRWAQLHGQTALHQHRRTLAALMARGQLRIAIARTFALEDFALAFEAASERGLGGRVLLLPNGPLAPR